MGFNRCPSNLVSGCYVEPSIRGFIEDLLRHVRLQEIIDSLDDFDRCQVSVFIQITGENGLVSARAAKYGGRTVAGLLGSAQRILALLVVEQPPTAAGCRNGRAIRVGTTQIDPDTERARQVFGLVDPLGSAGQEQIVRWWLRESSHLALMLLEPCEPMSCA